MIKKVVIVLEGGVVQSILSDIEDVNIMFFIKDLDENTTTAMLDDYSPSEVNIIEAESTYIKGIR